MERSSEAVAEAAADADTGGGADAACGALEETVGEAVERGSRRSDE
jgi:hypothetical protein